jgi:hypothetical protein
MSLYSDPDFNDLAHVLRRNLLGRSQLQAVRIEARRLWTALAARGSDGALQRQGADPTQASFRLSPEHPRLWELITSGVLPATVLEITGWSAIRPFHFYLLFKRPGAGMTAWHRDKDALPTSAPTITCWIPLSDVSVDSGLTYAQGTAALSAEEGMAENDGLDLIRNHGEPLVSTGAVRVGDVDFHDGKIWHCGEPNRMGVHRDVVGICYVPADACFEPDPPGYHGERGRAMRRELQKLYFSHLADGEMISGASHPIIDGHSVAVQD